MTTTNERLVVSFDNRKRAKDATLAIERMQDGVDCEVKVYVTTQPRAYIIDCSYPFDLDERIKGVLALGRIILARGVDEFDDIEEFYQGEGLSRFRGN